MVLPLRTIQEPMLVTGTRCVAKVLHANIIEAEIIRGPYIGQTVFIPRIPLIPSDQSNPVVFKRLQFPIKVCFALTMNRIQSQTFTHVGIDFKKQAFSHGQLYVAISRITRPKNLRLHFPDGNYVARNVVYKEVLH